MPDKSKIARLVFSSGSDKKPVDFLVEELKKTVYSYAGRMNVAEALGAIEIAKTELQREILD